MTSSRKASAISVDALQPGAKFVADAVLQGTVSDLLYQVNLSGQSERVLSSRERECLRFVAAGLKDTEIAQWMGISFSTVRFHVSNICRKLDAPNRSAAIYRATKTAII